MKKILFVNACLREDSRTERLCRWYLERYVGDDNAEVTELKLQDLQLQPLTAVGLRQRDALAAAGDWDNCAFRYAREFVEADKIIIGAPYYDLQFPAILKVYLENVCVCGIAFKYSKEGTPIGLCHADEAVYISTAGGFVGNFDFGYEYIKGLAKLVGIDSTREILAEGLDIVGNDVEKILQQTKEREQL